MMKYSLALFFAGIASSAQAAQITLAREWTQPVKPTRGYRGQMTGDATAMGDLAGDTGDFIEMLMRPGAKVFAVTDATTYANCDATGGGEWFPLRMQQADPANSCAVGQYFDDNACKTPNVPFAPAQAQYVLKITLNTPGTYYFIDTVEKCRVTSPYGHTTVVNASDVAGLKTKIVISGATKGTNLLSSTALTAPDTQVDAGKGVTAIYGKSAYHDATYNAMLHKECSTANYPALLAEADGDHAESTTNYCQDRPESRGSCYYSGEDYHIGHAVFCDVTEEKCCGFVGCSASDKRGKMSDGTTTNPYYFYAAGYKSRGKCCHCKASCDLPSENPGAGQVCTYYDVTTPSCNRGPLNSFYSAIGFKKCAVPTGASPTEFVTKDKNFGVPATLNRAWSKPTETTVGYYGPTGDPTPLPATINMVVGDYFDILANSNAYGSGTTVTAVTSQVNLDSCDLTGATEMYPAGMMPAAGCCAAGQMYTGLKCVTPNVPFNPAGDQYLLKIQFNVAGTYYLTGSATDCATTKIADKNVSTTDGNNHTTWAMTPQADVPGLRTKVVVAAGSAQDPRSGYPSTNSMYAMSVMSPDYKTDAGKGYVAFGKGVYHQRQFDRKLHKACSATEYPKLSSDAGAFCQDREESYGSCYYAGEDWHIGHAVLCDVTEIECCGYAGCGTDTSKRGKFPDGTSHSYYWYAAGYKSRGKCCHCRASCDLSTEKPGLNRDGSAAVCAYRDVTHATCNRDNLYTLTSDAIGFKSCAVPTGATDALMMLRENNHQVSLAPTKSPTTTSVPTASPTTIAEGLGVVTILLIIASAICAPLAVLILIIIVIVIIICACNKNKNPSAVQPSSQMASVQKVAVNQPVVMMVPMTQVVAEPVQAYEAAPVTAKA